MNTPSHWLITVFAGKLGPWKDRCPRFALGLGSIAPDIPLYFLSFGGIWYFSNVKGMERREVFSHLFSNLYYNDPIWISLHNFLHSPTMLAILFALVFMLRKVFPVFCRWMTFFLSACALHSIVDIFTHHDDGPVVFYPFNWTYRFPCPISYWDPDHHAGAFVWVEGIMDLLLIIALIWIWQRNRQMLHSQA